MDNLLGKIQWCGVKGEEITLGGYCPNFKQKIFKELDQLDINNYKFAVELLIGRVEEFIEDTIPESGMENEYEKEIQELRKRIRVVRKFEGNQEK